MTEGRGPEEFFEVFRSVQSNRKKRDEKPPPAGIPTDEPETKAAPPPHEPEPEPRLASLARVWERELTVGLPVVALAVLGALLVVVAAYMLGRQHGWQSHVAQIAKGSPATHGGAPTTASPAATVFSNEPEVNAEGKVFTLVMYSGPKSHDRAETEAKWLNDYRPFQALKVHAYVWRDKENRFRLCIRGLNDLPPANCDYVKKEIRKLKSSRGKPDYDSADFCAQ